MQEHVLYDLLYSVFAVGKASVWQHLLPVGVGLTAYFTKLLLHLELEFFKFAMIVQMFTMVEETCIID